MTTSGSFAARRTASIDGEGLRVPTSWDGTLDVALDDQRVWSVSPAESPTESSDMRWLAWPDPLRPHLDGLARVTVRQHLTGEVLLDKEVAFGSGQGRVRVVDRQGRPLAMEKWNKLNHPFESVGPEAIHAYLDQVEEVLAVLRDDCGLPAFLSYGSLLGATREGRVIGHDVDADVGYLSRYEHPADVIRESFDVERKLRARQWRVRRENGGFLALWFPQPDGTTRNLDVFTGFFVDDVFYQVHDIGAPLPRSAVVPLGTVQLEGREFAAPADPPALLEAAYGSGWRTPDPSFTFSSSSETRRRIRGWLGGMRDHRDYWNRVYSRKERKQPPNGHSAFAEWVHQREPEDTTIVDVGCGTGRDTLWFAERGHEVIGLDYSNAAIRQANARPANTSSSVRFNLFNLYDLRSVLATGADLAGDARRKALYSRFMVETLDDFGNGRQHLWRLAEMALRGGGRFYLEFRAHDGPGKKRGPDEDLRQVLSPGVIVAEIHARGGQIQHREAGWGLAPEGDEAPYVCRLIATWEHAHQDVR